MSQEFTSWIMSGCSKVSLLRSTLLAYAFPNCERHAVTCLAFLNGTLQYRVPSRRLMGPDIGDLVLYRSLITRAVISCQLSVVPSHSGIFGIGIFRAERLVDRLPFSTVLLREVPKSSLGHPKGQASARRGWLVYGSKFFDGPGQPGRFELPSRAQAFGNQSVS